MFSTKRVFKIPGKRWPGSVQVIASGRQVKLDLGELVELAHDVGAQLWLQEGASRVVPVTAGKQEKGLMTTITKESKD